MGSRYEALKNHLASRPEALVVLTFAELDRLVGGLPKSARHHPAWWSNSRRSQPHSESWLDAGRRATPDFNGGRVRFTLGAESPRGPQARSSNPASDGLTVTHPSGEVVELAVRFEWLNAGMVTLDAAGRVTVPRLPSLPGVYRFSLRGPGEEAVRDYIGESDNLSRRMAGYRNPGSSQATNARLAGRLQDVLSDGGSVRVSIATEASVNGANIDLRDRSARLLAENAALVLARSSNRQVENL